MTKEDIFIVIGNVICWIGFLIAMGSAIKGMSQWR